MEKPLIFASHNSNKTREIASMFNGIVPIVSLNDIQFTEEIEETGATLEANAAIKAEAIYQKTKRNCFADDTGLLVDALNGEPGVYSARYGGLEKDPIKNNEKLLENLMTKSNRSARFHTVICLILEGQQYFFSGSLEGTIGFEPIGMEGFGYDPIFIPLGSNRTLAEYTLEEKNTISHRARAFQKMKEFLENLSLVN